MGRQLPNDCIFLGPRGRINRGRCDLLGLPLETCLPHFCGLFTHLDFLAYLAATRNTATRSPASVSREGNLARYQRYFRKLSGCPSDRGANAHLRNALYCIDVLATDFRSKLRSRRKLSTLVRPLCAANSATASMLNATIVVRTRMQMVWLGRLPCMSLFRSVLSPR